MAVRFETYVCGLSIAGITGSNAAAGMDVRMLCGERPLRRADHLLRGLLAGVCVGVCV